MPKPEPSPTIVLRLLVARLTGESINAIAHDYGYKSVSALSNMAERYKLDSIGDKLRSYYLGQGAGLPPEVIPLNESYKKKLEEISELIYELSTSDENLDPFDSDGADKANFSSLAGLNNQAAKNKLDKMRTLESGARALESIRQSMIKIVTLSDGQKKIAKPEGIKTSFRDILDADNDDDDED
jgi:hypothetical protein